MSNQYDLVVIGSGPGGYVAAARASLYGLKTALVEKDQMLGGTCLHRGCIPTKALLHAADTFDEVKNGTKIGIKAAGVSIDWPLVQKYKSKIISGNALGVSHLMKTKKIDVINGLGRLLDKNTVAVEGKNSQTLKASHIILAVGSKPKGLPNISFSKSILSSDTILDLEKIPSSLAIIGGGVIGVEFASIFSRFGTKVTIIESLPNILNSADQDCVNELRKELEKSEVMIHTSAQVLDVKSFDDHAGLIIKNKDGQNLELKADHALIAIGRAPLTDNIGLEHTKVKLERGFVLVNKYLQSDEPNIYAIGDCVNTPWLAHVASREGLIAVDHLALKNPTPFNYSHTPFCVYSEPSIAWSGLTEKEAKEKGQDIKVSRFDFMKNGKASILQKNKGFIKFITDARYGEILGVHIVGPEATELLAEPSFAMQMENTIDDIAHAMHAHPTLYEAIYEAALEACGHPIHG